jgi:drug/metabolite transporter (DMT)-like permease
VNPISGSSWLWKALRGNSVTFAALFAFGILGISIGRIIKNALGAMGIPFVGLIILPIIIIGMIAKREERWLPDPAMRKKWSRRLVFGAIGASVLLALLSPKPKPTEGAPTQPDYPVRTHRPSGK